jgi:hypothetical protein
MLVGGTKRADGTLRPVVKIKQGYTPELDASSRTYEGPAKKMTAERETKTGQKPQIGGQVASKPNNSGPKKPSFNANSPQTQQTEKKPSFNANAPPQTQSSTSSEKKPSFNANSTQPQNNNNKGGAKQPQQQQPQNKNINNNQAKVVQEKPKTVNNNNNQSATNNAVPQTSEQSVNGQIKKLRMRLKEIKDLETKISEGYQPNEAQLQKIQKKSDFERDMLQLQEAVSKLQISNEEQK